MLFFLIGQFLYAQGWERTFDIYHESYHDAGKDILIASNGDFIISGHSEYTDEDSLHIFVNRISPQGDEIWSQVYRNNDPSNLALYGGRIVKASDDGYILGGITNEQGLLIVKIDENGDSLWTKNHTIEELEDWYY